jgi:2-dehydro-3-deoxygluconokinase
VELVGAVLVGEAMLELSRSGDKWQLGYGGDTLNTAIHLARALALLI